MKCVPIVVGLSVATGLMGVASIFNREGCAALLSAQPPAAESPASPAKTSAAPSVAALAFLAGTWSGTMQGDPVEETWSTPKGDSIIGMFRWQSKDKTTLWEFLSIKDEAGTATLRLRHFDSSFSPWKGECDGVAALKASTVEAANVVFTNDSAVGGIKSCQYQLKDGSLHITVSFKDEKRETLAFKLSRSATK